jgi:hypothetical protein
LLSLKLGVAEPKSYVDVSKIAHNDNKHLTVFSIAVLAAAVMLSHAISGCWPPRSSVAINWWLTGQILMYPILGLVPWKGGEVSFW